MVINFKIRDCRYSREQDRDRAEAAAEQAAFSVGITTNAAAIAARDEGGEVWEAIELAAFEALFENWDRWDNNAAWLDVIEPGPARIVNK